MNPRTHHPWATGLMFLVTVSFWLVSRCTAPHNPWSDPGNISISIAQLTPTDTVRVGDTLTCQIRLALSNLVDSVKVSFGDGSDTILNVSRPSDGTGDSLTVSHVYATDGLFWTVTRAYAGSALKVDSIPLLIRPAKPSRVDTAKPALRLLDPGIERSSISNPYLKIDIVVKDDRMLKIVRCRLGADSFVVSNVNDSVFSATVTGLKPDSLAAISFHATDSAGNTSSLTVHVTYKPNPSDTDATAPTLRLFDPPRDSMVVSSPTRTVKVVVTDLTGVGRVRFEAGSDTFPAVQSQDSVWTATVTGLAANVMTEVIVKAWDKSDRHNMGRICIHLEFDPAATDNTPPTFRPVAGITQDMVVRASAVSGAYEIRDASGVDSAYWSLNGSFVGTLVASATAANQFTYSGTLTAFGTNRIVVCAVDKSTNRNRDSVVLTLDYNTPPTPVTLTAPANAAHDVATAAPSFRWTRSTDQDGDRISYVVQYGTDQADLASAVASADTSCPPAAALKGNTLYYWRVLVVSGTDTLVCPRGSPWSFSTHNTPPRATLQSPSSGATGVSVTPTLMYDAAKGDGDPVSYTILLGTTRSLTSANQLATALTAEQYPVTVALQNAAKYFWRVIATETQGYSRLSDTTAVDSFLTVNRPPVWILPTIADTCQRRLLWDLSSLCRDPDGHSLAFTLIAGVSARLNGSSLTFIADSQEVSLRAIDSYAPQPCTATVTFTSYWFRNPLMKWIKAGSFIDGYNNVAAVSRGFWIDSTEVTQADYQALRGLNPSTYRGDRKPVGGITWYDAIRYCNLRSRKHGLDTVYSYDYLASDSGANVECHWDRLGYRLPTEDEWEYACRAGSTSSYYWGDNYSDAYPTNARDSAAILGCAWFAYNNTPSGTKDVATKKPNAWGLYDMAGNASEWCWDIYDEFGCTAGCNLRVNNRIDYRGATAGTERVRRSASFEEGPKYIVCSDRSSGQPQISPYHVGIRLVLQKQ